MFSLQAEEKMIPVISFVGSSNSGKTTYLEKLIRELKSRGYKVAVIKHDAHGFEMDVPGKDTWRHAQAGADIVCISAPQKMALIQKVTAELSLDAVIGHISGVDIIFTEGYKRENKPKIEVFRKEAAAPVCRQEDLLAMVSDTKIYDSIPCFGLEAISAMADFLEFQFLGREML